MSAEAGAAVRPAIARAVASETSSATAFELLRTILPSPYECGFPSRARIARHHYAKQRPGVASSLSVARAEPSCGCATDGCGAGKGKPVPRARTQARLPV